MILRKIVKVLVLLSLMAITPVWSMTYGYGGDQPPVKKMIDLQGYNVSRLEVRKSILEMMLNYQWQIRVHEKERILAVYKDTCQVQLEISDSFIVIEELESPCHFKPAWIKSLKSGVIQKLTYYDLVQQAKGLLDEA
ncbi:hypothetical protein [Shewanella sp. 6_MG-2023]|uniref:hypothetical protein n=1 Tax=Shewanella sp. 6_MG-2023 TaxID=3062660 RepID=UPI0026E3DA66|nr:hypothetical protein [Shewanella sp. 6_MG-2023]MDO6618776.1 hypothetical protein [Shewanella sp. 6_MG-2023]